MSKKTWVALTANEKGEVMAEAVGSPPAGGWTNGRWLVVSIYTGCTQAALAIVEQVKALGPNPGAEDAVAVLWA